MHISVLNLNSLHFLAGIPQMVLLTKIDEACPQMKGNLQNVYKVKKVKEKVCLPCNIFEKWI